jgi:hypothetical protein
MLTVTAHIYAPHTVIVGNTKEATRRKKLYSYLLYVKLDMAVKEVMQREKVMEHMVVLVVTVSSMYRLQCL